MPRSDSRLTESSARTSPKVFETQGHGRYTATAVGVRSSSRPLTSTIQAAIARNKFEIVPSRTVMKKATYTSASAGQRRGSGSEPAGWMFRLCSSP